MIAGLFTSLGISKTIDAANDEGFFIYPTKFGVSDTAGPLDPSRTDPTAGLWYQQTISARVVMNENTVKFVCTIPQSIGTIQKNIKEIYLFGIDSNSVEFMLALGQPTENLLYDPDGTLTLELQVSLVDIDLTSAYIFDNSMAVELDEHEHSPDAHIELVEAMSNAGIFVEGGALPFEHKGQNYDLDVEFDGTKASANTLIGGLVVSAKFNGTEQNGVVITFNGLDNIDTIITNWNADNGNLMLTHNGSGAEVVAGSSITLTGGTYLVEDKRNVYKDIDGVYKLAIADNTIRAKAIGICKLSERRVTYTGLIDFPNSYAISDVLYLSSATEGRFATLNNGINLGIVIDSTTILYTGFKGATDVQASQTFDAIVTDVVGAGLFETTQSAIDFVPNYGRIMIDKVEELGSTLDTQGKTLDIVFNGIEKGWRRYSGQVASFRVDFSETPTQGNWRMEWNLQESAVLPFDVDAAGVEYEFNLFSGHTGVTVTGDTTAGFLFQFNDEIPQPIPTFDFAGLNEIQEMTFNNIPDDGTMRMAFEGDETLNFPWDDSAADLKLALEVLPEIDELLITGEFATGFYQFEFTGNFFTNGLMPRPSLSVVNSTLSETLTETQIDGKTPSVDVPFDITTIQQGKYPSSNLWNAFEQSVVITATGVQDGQAVGPGTAILVDADNFSLTGLGLIEDFDVGVDLNGFDQCIVEARFNNVALPIDTVDKLPGVSVDVSNSMGFAKDVFAQMKITTHPTNKRRVKVSAADVILPNGAQLVQELNSLLLAWDGAEIDFATGSVYEADGVTILGQNFVPVIPASEMWRWASITISPKDGTAEDRISGQVLVTFATDDGINKINAKRAPFPSGKPLGQVALRGDIGIPEISRIVATRDEFSSLDGLYFTLFDAAGSVAFWIDMTGSTAEPAHGANRSVRITGITENNAPNVVATRIHAAVDGDSQFNATLTENRIVATDVSIGPRANAEVGTTPFFVDTLQEGRDTDVTGLSEIKNSDILQLGTGSGGGGKGTILVDFFDPVTTELPTGVSVTIDGVVGEDGDVVVFNSLLLENFQAYELKGVGVAIQWIPKFLFANGKNPSAGEDVRITKGNAFGGQKAYFETEWTVNYILRMFDGPDFIELTSIKRSPILDNATGDIFTVNISGSENMTLEYSIVRGTRKETGILIVTSDGVEAGITRHAASLSTDVGVGLNVQIAGSDITLGYDSDDSGDDAEIKYMLKRWSDAPGGPTGIPSYSGGGGSSVLAAGNVDDIQFHGAGGTLSASTDFKYNTAKKAIIMNGMEIGRLIGPLSLNDDQSSSQTLVQFDTADYEYVIMEYSISRGANRRTGRLLICSNGSSVGFSDDYSEFGTTGITLTGIQIGSNIEVQYISSSTGEVGEFKYSTKVWK